MLIATLAHQKSYLTNDLGSRKKADHKGWGNVGGQFDDISMKMSVLKLFFLWM